MNYKKENAIFSIAYFPPIEFFSKLIDFKNIEIEKYENFIKQTYRNRCNILSANGLLSISIPIKKEENLKTLIKDIRIDYATNWQKIHYKSIESAYKSSPFYDYYIDDFLIFFQKKYNFLYDYNFKIIEILFATLKLDIKIADTKDFMVIGNENYFDFRYTISPKNKSIDEIEIKYKQVFSEKFEFVPNLSILDALFNLGPETENYLNRIKKPL